MRLLVSLLTLLTLIFIAPLRADDKPVSYYKQVRPIFVSNCNHSVFVTHVPVKDQGAINLFGSSGFPKDAYFLASSMPTYLIGQCLNVDGGIVME